MSLYHRSVFFFPCYCLGNQSQPSLPGDSLPLLVSASSLLEHVGLCLRNAEIDVNTLQNVEKRRASFLNLYSLVSEDKESTESGEKTVGSQMSEVSGSQKETSTIKLFLDMRIDELEALEKERDAVRCFVEMCSMVQSGELPFKIDVYLLMDDKTTNQPAFFFSPFSLPQMYGKVLPVLIFLYEKLHNPSQAYP